MAAVRFLPSLLRLLRLLALQALRTAGAAAAPLRLHLLKDAGARCNDGSDPGFYIREGRSEVVLVWLEGGGDCGTQAACDARPATLKGSARWPQLRQLDGVFSGSEDTNPFFAAATHVFVPYCSSDSWVGNRDEPVFGYFFHGERIISAVFSELRNRSAFEGASLVVFGGCSAGGRGALYNLDRVCSLLPQSVRCRGLLDAAWWIPDDGALDQGAKDGLRLWGPSQSLEPCLEWAGDRAYLCLFGLHFAPYVRTPFLVHEEQFDYFMLGKRGVERPVFLWGPEAWLRARDLQQEVKSTLPILAGRRDAAAFSATCTQHCFAESHLFWSVQMQSGPDAGWSLERLARSWLEAGESRTSSHVLLEACSDPNCSRGCPFEPSLLDTVLFACLLLTLLACCTFLLVRRRSWLLARCRRKPGEPIPAQILGASYDSNDS